MPTWRCVSEDAAVKDAQDTLNALLKVETTDDIRCATITVAREALAAALTKQTAAHSKLYSVGAGPINMLPVLPNGVRSSL